MKITKRDGSIVDFDSTKILKAIQAAMTAVEMPFSVTADLVTQDVVAQCEKMQDLTVEGVQDLVEEALMKRGHYKVCKAYIKYRYLQQMSRERYSDLMNKVRTKLMANKVVNQNANVDEQSFGGRAGEATSVLMREFASTYLVSPKSMANHNNNRIYIHDFDHWALGDHNCLSIPFDKLLAEGFDTRQTDVRPAQSVGTAFQLVAVIFQLQSLQQFGGVSATHLDWTMVPYVRKSFKKKFLDGLRWVEGYLKTDPEYIKYTQLDSVSVTDERYSDHNRAYSYAWEMLENEVEQAVEGMYHNLNTLQSRSGNQLPFTSINYGTCMLPEGRLVTRKLLEVSIKGIGRKHRTSIFPCGIFQYMKGVTTKGCPNYDLYRLALKSTALRLYPNYANVDWSGNAGYDKNDPRTYFSTMGCRTANGMDINGLGQLKDGRGNICPVTIILPTLAKESNDVEDFMRILDEAIHDAKDTLLERFEWICSQSPASAKFMYNNGLMAGYVPEEGIRSALKHGTLVIGQLGLAECLQILIGKDHTSPEGMELAKRIEALFKKRCAEFKEQERLNFGVYYTPAENLCHTALKKFRDKYGVIKNVSDKEFFTNSMHVPVWKKMSIFDKIAIEAELTGYSSAGCITYGELDASCKNNIDALEKIVDFAMDHDIPYLALNPPNDQCQNCGYLGDIPKECPKCGSANVTRLRRVTGYLSTDYHNFNAGKVDEVEKRVKHNG
jgi:ribonucleoside-triphosphate reductase